MVKEIATLKEKKSPVNKWGKVNKANLFILLLLVLAIGGIFYQVKRAKQLKAQLEAVKKVATKKDAIKDRDLTKDETDSKQEPTVASEPKN